MFKDLNASSSLMPFIVLAVMIGSSTIAGAARSTTAILVEGNTKFAFDLYGQLKDGDNNLFFSPYSISTALAMTHAGARGATAQQMAAVLHFNRDQEQLHRAFSDLETHLNSIRGKTEVELKVANAIWSQQDHALLNSFQELVAGNYRAKLETVDFKTAYDAVRKEINRWVEQQTNDKIKNLIPEGALDSLTRLVLVNAIYFKGMWAEQFVKKNTADADFWQSQESRAKVAMMHQEKSFNYMENADLQLLELPYAGRDLAMLVLLPKEIEGLAALEENLTADNIQTWGRQLRKQKVKVYLPRFKMTSQFSLAQTLAAMGMPDAFQPKAADFSGIAGSRDLFISAIVHKALVEVNEEGTEAAAATGIMVGVTSLPPPTPVFRADHPFIFLIQDKVTKSVLFMGRLVDPQR